VLLGAVAIHHQLHLVEVIDQLHQMRARGLVHVVEPTLDRPGHHVLLVARPGGCLEVAASPHDLVAGVAEIVAELVQQKRRLDAWTLIGPNAVADRCARLTGQTPS
jgi:hypothetical protein